MTQALPHRDAPAEPPSRGAAFAYWLQLGFTSFGGPAGQIALMHAELVERRRWISERRFLHALDYCMLLPGPEAQQLATYLGWLMHRTWGGVVAGSLFVLPSLVILVALSYVYMRFGHVPLVAAFFQGIKPAVTAIVAQAAWRLGSRALGDAWRRAIAVAAFFGLAVLRAPFPVILLAAGAAGLLGARLAPRHFGAGHAHARSGAVAHPALIDDDMPPPAHARFTWPRFIRVLIAAVALWTAAAGGLALALGPDAMLTQMAGFFTQAALVSFGGAYAVLPYVLQGAVDRYHWLTPAQMIDGLALGETTPGPLVMVVAFVAFVGGWNRAFFGADAAALAGVAAALVATFFTFLPSFFFILLGAPFIESTRGNLALAAPLAGISAAVVGVIASLAVFFAAQVLWPHGAGGPFAWRAAALGLTAGVAMWRFGVGVIPVVLGAGAVGLLLTAAGMPLV